MQWIGFTIIYEINFYRLLFNFQASLILFVFNEPQNEIYVLFFVLTREFWSSVKFWTSKIHSHGNKAVRLRHCRGIDYCHVEEQVNYWRVWRPTAEAYAHCSN